MNDGEYAALYRMLREQMGGVGFSDIDGFAAQGASVESSDEKALSLYLEIAISRLDELAVFDGGVILQSLNRYVRTEDESEIVDIALDVDEVAARELDIEMAKYSLLEDGVRLTELLRVLKLISEDLRGDPSPSSSFDIN